MRQTRLSNESAEYVAAREQLRHAEIELMRQGEQVAALRRELPPGAPVADYVFEEGPSDLSTGDEPVRRARLSCGTNSFKYDLGSEDEAGNQDSTISVFTRDGDGTVRHFYTAHPRMADDIDQRGIDLLSPVWNIMDLTLEGRGDWYAELRYPARHALAQR